MATNPDFDSAVARFAAVSGAPARPITRAELTDWPAGEPEDDLGGVTVGYAFEVPTERADALLTAAQDDLLAMGSFLLRGEPEEDADATTRLLLLPTADPSEVMALMGTNGLNYDLATEDLVAWLRELEREQPFVLTGCGFDWLEGRFTTPVRDPVALARRLEEFCPDTVAQVHGSLKQLADRLRRGTFFLWWD
jgi:Domain of unknown function (DUF4253)